MVSIQFADISGFRKQVLLVLENLLVVDFLRLQLTDIDNASPPFHRPDLYPSLHPLR